MKVLYNISPVGTMHFKGGGWRVTESLAEQLVKRDDLEIKFCSNSILSTFEAKEYISNTQLSSVDFSQPPLSKATKGIVQWHARLMGKIHTKGISSLKKKALKGERRLFDTLSKGIFNISEQNLFLNPEELETFSVYHSVCFLLPKAFNTKNKIQSFYTHMDIIPILFPEIYGELSVKSFKANLDKLTRDMWILCLSECSRNDLLNYMGDKIDPAKTFVTYLAASPIFHKQATPTRQILKEKYGIPDGPYMLTLSTFDPRKNLHSVIKAFLEIVKQEHIHDLNLVLAGEQSFMSDDMKKEITDSAELSKRIFITGSVPDEDLVELYNNALVFVFPSLYEGFGLPPLEAMQCGTPVISSNVSSLSEVVGDAAIMIHPTDLDALSQAMLSVYKSSTLGEQLSEKSLERAKLFSWQKCADDTVSIYKKSVA